MKRLGDVLIEEGLVEPQELELALLEQKRTGELLGDVLLRLGLVTRKAISRAMADTTDLPYVDLSQTHIDINAVKLVPESMARKFNIIPFAVDNGTIQVAMNNPTDVVAIDTLRRQTGKVIDVWASDLETIQSMIETYYEVSARIAEEVDRNVNAALAGGIAEGEAAPPVIRLVELLIIKAIRDGATDLHVTLEEAVSRVSYRIDGILRRGFILPTEIHRALVTRIKVLSTLNIAEQRLPQEGNISFEFSGRTVDIRSSTSPTELGENVVLRILDKANIILGLEHLGMSEAEQLRTRQLAQRPHGIVLAAGPTGCGKTTTLYSMLREINALEKNLLTIEDPIEYRLPLIKQTQVNEQAGLTFSNAIRHFLRQDPDVILVGEIRDLETAQIAFQAAMTGHLVLSTIHTNDAASTMARLLDLGVDTYLIPSSLRAVVAQRLVRKVCSACAEDYIPSDEELQSYGLQDWSGAGKTIKKAAGCPACDNTGYSGRTGVFEILEISPQISRLIMEKVSADLLNEQALEDGMVPMRANGLNMVIDGLTTLEEVFRVT